VTALVVDVDLALALAVELDIEVDIDVPSVDAPRRAATIRRPPKLPLEARRYVPPGMTPRTYADPTSTLVIRPSVLYFGTPVLLVSTLNLDGSTNVAPMSSAWALDDRVILGLGEAGQTIRNLRRERQCVLNVPGPDLWRSVEAMAGTTGREDVPAHKRAIGFRFERDKLARAGLTPSASEIVAPPRPPASGATWSIPRTPSRWAQSCHSHAREPSFSRAE
jgi:flavin reductase (DIM6/NTAB) family NADH-FMN oxidoreductase RutF